MNFKIGYVTDPVQITTPYDRFLLHENCNVGGGRKNTIYSGSKVIHYYRNKPTKNIGMEKIWGIEL